MRSLSATLLAAQQAARRVPYVKVQAKNKIGGVVRLDWTQLYSGAEEDYYHAAAMPEDGSIIRLRVTPPADGRKLYLQRVTQPGPGSDFSQWVYCNQYGVMGVAACALGAEVSLFWIKSDCAVYQQKSNNCGASWSTPEVIDYAATSAINGMAAAYKPDGDIGLFFGEQTLLYVKRFVSGSWQSKSGWNKSTGDLSGAAAIYDGDFDLLVTGKDINGNFKAWSLIYGDGVEVPAGTWSELKEIASAPADNDFEYRQPCLARPDVYRCFFVEKFSGEEAYSRPFYSNAVPEASFVENLWREPAPFNLSSDYGLAMVHHGEYGWLCSASSIWRAKLSEESLDLTSDVVGLKQEIDRKQGKLSIELDNSSGRYASPGEGELAVLNTGCEIEVSPGYSTSQGNESSAVLTFQLEAFEHVSRGGKASLILHARDGWNMLRNWSARYQLSWNRSSQDTGIKDMLAFLLSRCGLKLEVKTQSTALDECPEFTVHAGNRGDAVIEKLLSQAPDAFFIEGNKAYVLNPQATDEAVYAYGETHQILEGRYRRRAREVNRVQVEGYNAQSGQAIMLEAMCWEEIGRMSDRLIRLEDRNIGSVGGAEARGEAVLRHAAMESMEGFICIPVNCGQQLFDVIEISDARAGLSHEKRRVLGMVLNYQPLEGVYEQKLLLGAV